MDGLRKDSRYKIAVKGTVQGVGFRPFIYNLASSLDIKGFVTNTSSGVEIEAEGENTSLFINKIETSPPPLSHITSIDVTVLPPANYSAFEIKKSVEDKHHLTFIPPDVSVCVNCRKELYDKNDRHYHYPFTNCTNCGPRYSITRTIPYDRKNTTMSSFRMCPDCESEYNNPSDRRFHAQPNACPKCGPQLELKINNEKLIIYRNNPPSPPFTIIPPCPPLVKGGEGGFDKSLLKQNEDSIKAVLEILKLGFIVAIKGIGGFLIACDAENEEAVKRLRERKKRGNKPFAIMCPDIRTAEYFAEVDNVSMSLLLSHESPVVLMKKRNNSALADSISPNNPYYGIMLPYTPLHDLLSFYPDGKTPNFNALVMTSGNISEEPIIKYNEEALEKLKDICDAFLLHNRDIFMRLDDSVIMNPPSPLFVKGGQEGITFIRRARGYVPNPISLPFNVPPLLACGAELKSTFTIAKDNSAIVSQHLGDMDNYETLRFFEETLSNLKAVFNIEPGFIFYDMHPDYIITRWAKEKDMKGFPVQHHEAHIAACIAENSIEGDVIGIALDGTGYGTDGNIWGGEIFTGNLDNLKRVAHLRYIPIPGGEMAIKEPWRMALSALLYSSENNMDHIIERWGNLGAEKIIEMIRKNINSPFTSSCGRLFDAAGSIIAGFDKATFEAEAAIGLEALAFNYPLETGEYSYDIVLEDENNPGHKNSVIPEVLNRESRPPLTSPLTKGGINGGGERMIVIDFKNTFNELLEDIRKGKDKRTLASLFHNTIASAITEAVQKISQSSNIKNICLSGGVFQNKIFTEMIINKLSDADLNVFTHRLLPPNDGSISLGQAAIGGWRVRCA
ncbi:MAG: carbamoyltransferase HypF [Nitrospirota bacterium]